MPQTAHGKAERETASSRHRWIPITVAIGYWILGAIWIASTDWLLYNFLFSSQLRLPFETLKGWIWMAVTATLLYFILRSALDRQHQFEKEISRQISRLDFIVQDLGGLWEMDLQTGALMTSYHLKAALGFPASFEDTESNWFKYIHPDDLPKVTAVRNTIQINFGRTVHLLYRIADAEGEYHWLDVRARIIRDENGKPVRLMGLATDVTETKRTEDRLEHLLNYDVVTSLPNRASLIRWLDDFLPKQSHYASILLLRLDIARFREFVSRYGHDESDSILRAFGERLTQFCDAPAFVAHLGADEFAVAIPNIRSSGVGYHYAESLLAKLDEAYTHGDEYIHLNVRCGAALSPRDGESSEALMVAAGLALSETKKSQTVKSFYAQGMSETYRLMVDRGQALRGAIERDEMSIHYQPVVSLQTGKTVGFEALLRWFRPNEGFVPPAHFIPLAEELGLIDVIGRWVLEQACLDVSQWTDDARGPFVAVNVSPLQLNAQHLLSDVASALAKSKLSPSRLELEITETALTQDYVGAAARLRPLLALGVSIAVDDFGTGYSSLTALRHLPFTRLKLDRSFVIDYARDDTCTVIIDGVIALAQAMKLGITAEGIETIELLENMQKAGCSLAQGYLFSPPVATDQAVGMINWDWFDYSREGLCIKKQPEDNV